MLPILFFKCGQRKLSLEGEQVGSLHQPASQNPAFLTTGASNQHPVRITIV
jgi:hypothetical protein